MFFWFPPKAVDEKMFFFNVSSFFSPRSLKVWMDCNFRSLQICLGKKSNLSTFCFRWVENHRRCATFPLSSRISIPMENHRHEDPHQDLAANKSLSNHSDDSDGSEVGRTVFLLLGGSSQDGCFSG